VSDQIIVSLISSAAAIVVSLIAAWSASGRATAAATAPLNAKIEEQRDHITEQGVLIQRLREKVLELRGDPDDA